MWKYSRRSNMATAGRRPAAGRRARTDRSCRGASLRASAPAAAAGLPSWRSRSARMCFATDAALALWMPCSRKTTPAISGLSRGAKKVNQPWSRRFRVLFRAAQTSLEGDDLRGAGLAADVLAGNRRAPRRAGAAVHDQPHAVADRLQLLRRHLDLRLRRRRRHGLQPLPSSIALTRCGVTRVPPLASVAV